MNVRLINIQFVWFSRQNNSLSGNHQATDKGVSLRYIKGPSHLSLRLLDRFAGSHVIIFQGHHDCCSDLLQITVQPDVEFRK